MADSRPRSPRGHGFLSDSGSHLLLANGSQVYRAGDLIAADLARALQDRCGDALDRILAAAGGDTPPLIGDVAPFEPPIRALSLAVAQKCNLGCTYCYAQQGDFGAAPRAMPVDVALRSVELLLSSVKVGERVNLAFLGGEPLLNRDVIRIAALYARDLARARAARITYSITTNGTLLTPEDGEFFESLGFAVTVSLDGISEVHDRLRPFKSGRGSFDQILERVKPLLAMQRRMQVSARVTVTPENLSLVPVLDGLIGLGFHSVGFSPLLSSPSGQQEMGHPELERMLEDMVRCADRFEEELLAGRRYPFLNVVNALREIHRGTHRPFPCGAGAGYMGVSADGSLSACHRFVEDPEGAMGSVDRGIDHGRQEEWLRERHVHRQEPCRDCWARYLCGGGCHHEVIHRGRPACDYIRGWLHHCLQMYVRLRNECPGYFEIGNPV